MSPRLKGLKVLLCVSSGIAIYKALDLASRLRKAGSELTIILSPEAREMVSDYVFSAVGNCPVYHDINQVRDGWILHTELSRWADVVVLAPATANTMAKAASGIADNLLLATILAAPDRPRLAVPTMNTRMYENPATLRNMKCLRDNGWHVIDPELGELACGEFGMGRYPDNSVIVGELVYTITKKALAGKKVLVTAGPTRERIDSVRFITNRSSGKMGYAVARAVKNAGANVTLVSGPTGLSPLYGIEMIAVESAVEMRDRVSERLSESDILIMAAAVADYAPESSSEEKLKKEEGPLELILKRTPDILLELKETEGKLLVGFCAEGKNLVQSCSEKMRRKRLDMIVANDISGTDSGFDSDYNEVWFLFKDGRKIHIPRSPKEDIAENLASEIANLQQR